MSKKVLVISIIILFITGGAALFATSRSNEDTTTQTGTTETTTNENLEADRQRTDSTNENTPAPAEADSVTIQDFAYSPSTITVKKGTTVTWTSQDTTRHDVTPDNETDEFRQSDLLGKGDSYKVTFNTPGEYTYHCNPHPHMTGKVIVTE